MTSQGVFISFEGIDGAGKSTHIEPLAQKFRNQHRAVTVTREPGGTPLAEKLRTLVLAESMDAMTEALLIFAGRRNHLSELIEPALARGEVVLCDRFTDATFAYQGAGRGFDLDMLAILERWVQGIQPSTGGSLALRQPDLTLWFDVAPKLAAERLANARAPDRFEALPVAFFERVAAGYALRMHAAPERFCRIDAANPRDQVWNDVCAATRRRGWLP